MPTWFKTTSSYTEIKPVEILRDTEQSVFLRRGLSDVETRCAKLSGYECYHPTWAAAHAHLMEEAENRLRSARLALERAQGFHGNAKGLKNPATEQA